MIDKPVILAPMAGITDHPFRLICREMGADIVYTEFVSANGIIRENLKTLDLMKFSEIERPIGIQIFGEDPIVVGQSARKIYDLFKPDVKRQAKVNAIIRYIQGDFTDLEYKDWLKLFTDVPELMINDEKKLYIENNRDRKLLSSMASDAFFPFRDNIDFSYKYNVKNII